MFSASFVPYIIKLIAPEITEKIANHIAKIFKLPQLVNYMELPNDVDQRVDKLEAQMQEQTVWIEQELGINLNPFSWGKKKK